VATLPAPHTWTAGDDATSTNLQSLTSAINFLTNPPRCKAYAGAAQTLTTAVAAAVAFNQEEIDNDAMHSTVTNNSRLTVVTAGRYRVRGQVTFVSNSTSYRTADLRATGTLFAAQAVQAANGTATKLQVEGEWVASVGDYFELYATQASGGNLDTASGQYNTFLHAEWIATA
jgi:hypothetical protein